MAHTFFSISDFANFLLTVGEPFFFNMEYPERVEPLSERNIYDWIKKLVLPSQPELSARAYNVRKVASTLAFLRNLVK